MELIKSKIPLFICSTLLFSLNTYSQSKIVSDGELKFIEDRVEKELANEKNTVEQKFQLNMITAREAYQFRFYEKANHYYTNATKLDLSENKTEAYINRIAISIVQNDKKKLAENFDEAKKYFEKNSTYKTKEIDYYLTAIEKSLGHSENPAKIEGFYGMYTNDENFKNLLKGKEYKKAFSLLNPEGIKKAENSFNITSYDTLNVLLNKKNVKELYCNKEYNEFPNAYATSTLICGLLNDYLKTGKFTDKKLKRAEKYFAQEDKEKKYLLDMVKELK